MNNPKTEEIVKSLRGCSTDEMDCKNCVAEWGRKYGYCFNTLRLYAADRLEALEVELSKLKEQQRWIPVTERLPGEDTVVLACDADRDMAVTCYFAEGFMNNVDLRTEDGVTHWMSLPEPPKE